MVFVGLGGRIGRWEASVVLDDFLVGHACYESGAVGGRRVPGYAMRGFPCSVAGCADSCFGVP